MSVTISTVVLTSIIVTSIVTTMFFASNIVESNAQSMEFSTAKNLYKYAADAIEQIALGSGGSRYLRIGLRTGGPWVFSNAFDLKVKVNGQYVIDTSSRGLYLAFKGGSQVQTVYEVIRPEINKQIAYQVLVDLDDPMVAVHSAFLDGSWIFLESARIRAGYLGLYRVRNPSGILEDYNIFEIIYINLTKGSIYGGSGEITLVFRAYGVREQELVFPGVNSLTLNISRTASFLLPPATVTQTIAGDPSASGSIVIVRVIDVRIDTYG